MTWESRKHKHVYIESVIPAICTSSKPAVISSVNRLLMRCFRARHIVQVLLFGFPYLYFCFVLFSHVLFVLFCVLLYCLMHASVCISSSEALTSLTSSQQTLIEINSFDQLVTKTYPRLRRFNRWLLYFNEWSGTVLNKERKERKKDENRYAHPIWVMPGVCMTHLTHEKRYAHAIWVMPGVCMTHLNQKQGYENPSLEMPCVCMSHIHHKKSICTSHSGHAGCLHVPC